MAVFPKEVAYVGQNNRSQILLRLGQEFIGNPMKTKPETPVAINHSRLNVSGYAVLVPGLARASKINNSYVGRRIGQEVLNVRRETR